MGVLDTGGNVLMIWLWGADRYEPFWTEAAALAAIGSCR